MKKRSRVPQWVAKSIDLKQWGVSQEHVDILKQGPKAEGYWQTWALVLRSAKKVVDGKSYKLSPCGDKKVLIVSKCFDLDTRAF